MSDRQISETAKTLIEAKKRIEDPDNRCIGELSDGDKVCAIGATQIVQGRSLVAWIKCPVAALLNKTAAEMLWKLGKKHVANPHVPAAYVNDRLGHDAVMEMFDLAIASKLSKGADK